MFQQRGGGSQRDTPAEAGRLGVDPVVWAHVQKYWAETHDENKEDALDGYELGTLRRHDIKSLIKGGQLTGDTASEIARRITGSAFTYRIPRQCLPREGDAP